MCVGYVTRQVWSVNCWLFTFFTIFRLWELGFLDFAGQGCHCPIPTRGTPHFALFFGGARVVLLYLLYLLAGHAVWVRLCAEQICSWITWDWMETFLHRWHRYLWTFWTMASKCIYLRLSCTESLLQMLQELKNIWKTIRKIIWGTSHTSAASVEKTLPTKNPCAFTRNYTWTANPMPAHTV